MYLKELKKLREYSERFWMKLPKGVQPEIIIENDISGTFDRAISNLGGKAKIFKPWTNGTLWSSWRVGIPVRWKGKTLILWLKGYHCSKGEAIMWLEDCIWNVETNKELRKDAARNCWSHIRAMAKKSNLDVSDVKLTRWSRPFLSDGWKSEHNGINWDIYPASHHDPKAYFSEVTDEPRRYWVQHSDSGFPMVLCDSLKEAKAAIKYDGGEWLSKIHPPIETNKNQ